MEYKKYRIYLNTTHGNYIPASSNTVNDLVSLFKYWLERTNEGFYLPMEASGTVILQQIDKKTGAYVNEKRLPFKGRNDLINAIRTLGAR